MNIWFVFIFKKTQKMIFLSFKIKTNKVCITTQINEQLSYYIGVFINSLS